jgi:hypothetical protein
VANQFYPNDQRCRDCVDQQEELELSFEAFHAVIVPISAQSYVSYAFCESIQASRPELLHVRFRELAAPSVMNVLGFFPATAFPSSSN